MSLKDFLSKETSEVLRSMADDMCAFISSLSPQNYEAFVRTRDEYVSLLKELTKEDEDVYDSTVDRF